MQQTTANESVTLRKKIREMDALEIEQFLDGMEVKEATSEIFHTCAVQWKQLTNEPFPYTITA